MTKPAVLLATLTVATLMFAAPLSASAASLTPQQIQAIISLLQSFGADQSVINNVSAALGGTAPSSSCVTLSGNLTLGSTDSQTGGQVSQLQNYLINKGYLTGTSATGYYGFLTAQGVGKLQVALGIVASASDTAYGIMGPKTRAAIACSSNQPSAPSTSAPSLTRITPTSGSTNTVVTLSGYNLGNATEVDFYHSNGQLGWTVPSTATDISISANSISFTINGPAVGISGPDTYTVKVVTPSGTSNSESFTITQ